LPDEAGRAAYLAGLQGAQALIFEPTGNIIKRHRGVQRTSGGESIGGALIPDPDETNLMADHPHRRLTPSQSLPWRGTGAVADHYPTLVEEGRSRGAEFIAHGLSRRHIIQIGVSEVLV
jgi:hypothetical protein